TGSESVDWNTAARRVTLPSTISSYTTSAWLSPSCGRASLPRPPSALSIFTTSAGRLAVAGSFTGRPGKGDTAGAAAVGVVPSVVDVVVVAVVDVLLPLLQAATDKSPTATNAGIRRRFIALLTPRKKVGISLELPKSCDPLFERGVRVEQAVQAREATLLLLG